MNQGPHHERAGERPGTDTRAAFIGLVVGAIALLAIVVGITYLTNASFAGHEASSAPATTPH
jgi:hypothetical protein